MEKKETVTNSCGRILPKYIEGYGEIRPFLGAFETGPIEENEMRIVTGFQKPGGEKLVGTIKEALEKSGIKDGMTISFHHHLREGDEVVNMAIKAIRELGIKNLKLAPSALFETHKMILESLKDGTIRQIEGSMNGSVGRATSEGKLSSVAVLRSHGGRVRAIRQGDLKIDIAIIAAPTADPYGNANGLYGKNACGPLAYSHADSLYAKKVIIVTDNLVKYPAIPVSISQINVDFVVVVDSIGDHNKIVSGTTSIQSNPISEKIAKFSTDIIEHSGYFKDGFSIQAGAGGISLSVVKTVGELMEKKGIKAAWANGGTTAILVDLFKRGLIEKLSTCQAFDLVSVQSLKEDPMHLETNIDFYANPFNKGCLCNLLDVVILGATEVDVNYNVNVNTHSDGYLLHGIGGHQDTAACAKLTIITVPIARKTNPIIIDDVTTITTPGECIDVVVTEVGVAINPKRKDLIENLSKTDIPLFTIEQLRDKAKELAGRGYVKPKTTDRVIGVIEWRDGTVIDVVHQVDLN
eukprot:Anaeramoba_ignava/a348187_99.p1 GENE.a348187_99~~a348187_99.p1  ORF type:complete len:547 (-),score=118.57 a348187_99:1317-2882(-)